MAFNKKELEQSFKSITIYGFIFKKEIMGYSWTKDNNNRTEKIIIGYAGYPDSYRIYTPLADIYFKEVEDILVNFKNEYYPEKHYGNSTIRKLFVKIDGINFTKFDTDINSEQSYNEVALEINKIIEKGALPFFEKYDNLYTVFEETEIMPRDELRNFIVQPLPQRRMVIKKLCDNHNYKEYVKGLIEYYKLENDEDLEEIEKLDRFLNKIL